jgi:bifunctional UDP-N-acetylglucosamine pyrophosphorylase/glucosamine-1-phosphate N-acetyltransferase
MGLSAVILAAGEGKRLRTRHAKVLHEALGLPLLAHVLAAVGELAARPLVVVVGHLKEQVIEFLHGQEVEIAVQDPPRGTGDALAQALPNLPQEGVLLVLSGDVPLLTSATLRALVEPVAAGRAAATLATAVLADGARYGRILRGPDGGVAAIVEAGDASVEVLAMREVNAGTYAFDLSCLRPALAGLRPDNAQGEYSLTDVLSALVHEGRRVLGLPLADAAEMAGVNTRAELAEVNCLLNRRVVQRLQAAGVTILDPATTWVDADCEVGPDSVLEAGVHLRRGCRLGTGCRIGAHSVLDGVKLLDGAVVPPLSWRSGEE